MVVKRALFERSTRHRSTTQPQESSSSTSRQSSAYQFRKSVPRIHEGSIETAQEMRNKLGERVAGMTDEDAEEFYSCRFYNSYPSNLVCILNTRRPGLCDAYTRLDFVESNQIGKEHSSMGSGYVAMKMEPLLQDTFPAYEG